MYRISQGIFYLTPTVCDGVHYIYIEMLPIIYIVIDCANYKKTKCYFRKKKPEEAGKTVFQFGNNVLTHHLKNEKIKSN